MIDFGYAFSSPHVLTLSRPSASEKVIAEAMKEGLRFSWTHRNLKEIYPLSWETFPMDVKLFMDIIIENDRAEFNKWYRHFSGAPYLFAEGEKNGVCFTFSAIAAKKGIIIKAELTNNNPESKEVIIEMAHLNGWVISNKGWADGINHNVLLKMNDGRADKFICLAQGANDYLMFGLDGDETNTGTIPPMANDEFGVSDNSMKKISALYKIKKGDTRIGWFILPYEEYFENLESLKKTDFEKETKNALKEWEKLLNKGTEIKIDDDMLLHCYKACLADLFVMREEIGDKNTGISCGTNVYRNSNSGEPLESDILLDTLGYHKEAVSDFKMHLEAQEENGNWASEKGWEHESRSACFNKASAVMNHYKITGDVGFLKKYYKNMYDSTMFNYSARQSTKKAKRESERGLMPRGMGDCGMMNGKDYYGVFYPHNVLSVAADRLTLEAAKILHKTGDVIKLREIYIDARRDLLFSMRNNLAEVDGLKIIPSIAGAKDSSLYGCLYSLFPAELVNADDPILEDTVKYIESKQISEGGLPIGTGWMKDGLWVAMALSNFARAYLRMGKYDLAKKFLYPVLNHATPFVTWCEERGCEKNTKKTSGDRQHLWTPLSVCQYLIDALFFETESTIHIFAGADNSWLAEGKKISVKGLNTSFGKTDITAENKKGRFYFSIKAQKEIDKDVIVHLPKDEKETDEIKIYPVKLKSFTTEIEL
ncbi:MAG: hypothetical protein J6M16_00415 [Clostridia bacterium]|nr:hypothetical protein [Clostridia bacterium]